MPRTRSLAVFILLLPLATLACAESGSRQGSQGGGEAEPSAGETATRSDTSTVRSGTTVALSAREGSGISGEVRLTPSAGSVRLELSLTGLDEEEGYPAHLHDGTCEDGGAVVEPLGRVTGRAGGRGAATARVDAPAAIRGPRFVQVHGPDGEPVACGDLPPYAQWGGPAPGPDTDVGAEVPEPS